MPGTTATPFGFAGQHGYQTDADSGLMRLGYRYYDASTGRFLSREPIRDIYNRYAYCANDPVNAVDPTGLQTPITPILGGEPMTYREFLDYLYGGGRGGGGGSGIKFKFKAYVYWDDGKLKGYGAEVGLGIPF